MIPQENFLQVRKNSIEICKPLKTEDYVVQPSVDISPPKWHLAHTTWFWEAFVLTQYLQGYRVFHERYNFLFNSYYNSMGERTLRLDRGNMSRPTVDEIFAYRQYVDEHMAQLLDQNPELDELITLGINHEQQHQELLLTDIKYILGHNPLFPPYDPHFIEFTPETGMQKSVTIPTGQYPIGFSGDGFCFDNELGLHQVSLLEFTIMGSLTTNEAYLDFIKDGGYQNPLFWQSDGWAWVQENHIVAPMYWHQQDDSWFQYRLSGFAPIDLREPVTHISYYEAVAFAEWRNMRLPTEFEWEVANQQFKWGQRWEHTNSAFLPYPGYQKAPGAIGEYNGKFMVNQMVLRGGSVATPSDHSRPTYRNFFHPHLRWQFNGLRLCNK